MTAAKNLGLSPNTFAIATIPDLVVADLLETVEADGYAVIRGLFSPEQMRQLYEATLRRFNPAADHPGTAGGPTDVMHNFQKVIIGAGAAVNYYVPRFVRVMYNPLWDDDVYGAHAAFRQLAQLRNYVQGHSLDYAVEGIENRLWTAARLQHYPAGGGFFGPHRDAMSSTTTKEAGLIRFIQILLLVTSRGVHYQQGGAYIEQDGKRIDLEADCGAGDVLVYDGRTMHGVADIDPHCLPDLKTLSGRIAALVTLYADMSGDKAEFAHFRKRDFLAGK